MAGGRRSVSERDDGGGKKGTHAVTINELVPGHVLLSRRELDGCRVGGNDEHSCER